MTRGLKCVLISLVVGVAGCGADSWTIQPLIDSFIDAQCRNLAARAVVPDSVPAELAVVQADPEKFGPASHPLANVIVGTVLDDLSGLDGCWGHYAPVIEDGSPAGQAFAVLHFDLQAGKVTAHWYSAPAPNSDGSLTRANQFLGAEIFSDSPILYTEVYDITSMTDNLVTLQEVSAEGGSIGPDGRPVFNCLVAASSVDVQTTKATLGMLVTRQGDFLKEYLGGVEADGAGAAQVSVPDNVDELAALWVRFDCSTQ